MNRKTKEQKNKTPVRFFVFRFAKGSGSRGAIALISTLVVISVIFTVALSMSILGIGAIDVTRVTNESHKAFSVAEACLDEAMLRLLRDSSWTGDTLTVGDGSCTITVAGAGPFTINVVATVADATRRVEADFDVATNTITRWEEPTS